MQYPLNPMGTPPAAYELAKGPPEGEATKYARHAWSKPAFATAAAALLNNETRGSRPGPGVESK
jgi:hypothetical protein